MASVSKTALSVYGSSGFTDTSNITGAADGACTYSGTSGGEYVEVTIDTFSTLSDIDIINGIEVTTKWSRSDADDYISAYIVCGQGTSSTKAMNAGGGSTNCTGVVNETEGSSTDIWGLTASGFTGDDVNDAGDVRVRLTHTKSGKAGTVYIDSVTVTIYYTRVYSQSCSASVGLSISNNARKSGTGGIVSAWVTSYSLGTNWVTPTNIIGATDGACTSIVSNINELNCYFGTGFSSLPNDALIRYVNITLYLAGTDEKRVYVNAYMKNWGTYKIFLNSIGGVCANAASQPCSVEGDADYWVGDEAPIYGSDINGTDVFHIQIKPIDYATFYIDGVYVSITYTDRAVAHCTATVACSDRPTKLVDVSASETKYVVGAYLTGTTFASSWSSGSSIKNEPDGACTYTNNNTDDAYISTHLDILNGLGPSDATVLNFGSSSKCCATGDITTPTLDFRLYQATLGYSTRKVKTPPTGSSCSSSTTCYYLYAPSELGTSWTGVTLGDINDVDFPVHLEFVIDGLTNTTFSAYIDAVYCFIEYRISTGAHEYEYPTATVTITPTQLKKPKAIRAAPISITPSKKSQVKMLESSAVGAAGVLKNKPKTLQAGAVGIDASEKSPAYLKALAAAIASSTACMYATVHKESAEAGITAEEEFIAKKLVAESIGISLVEKLSKAYFEYVAADLGLSADDLYKVIRHESSAVGINTTEGYLAKTLLAAAIAVNTDEEYLAAIKRAGNVGIASVIQLEALIKAAEELGITATTEFPIYLKALLENVGIDGKIQLDAFLNTLAADFSISATVIPTLAKLIGAAIGIGANTSLSVFLNALAVSVGVGGAINFNALIKQLFGVSIDTAISTFRQRYIDLTADVSADGSILFPSYLKALAAAIDIEGVLKNRAKMFITSGVGVSDVMKSLVEILLDESLSITAQEYLEKLTEMQYAYLDAAIGMVGDTDMVVKKLLEGAVGIAVVLKSIGKVFEAISVGIDGGYYLFALKKMSDSVSILDEYELSVYLKAAASIATNGTISLMDVMKYLSESISITTDERNLLENLVLVNASIGISPSTALDVYLKALPASINADGTINFITLIKQAFSVDIDDVFDYSQLKTIAEAIGISSDVTEIDVLIKRAASIGISSDYQLETLLHSAASLSIGATSKEFSAFFQDLVASISVSGSVTFPSYLKVLSAVVSLSADIERRALTHESFGISFAANRKLIALIHENESIDIEDAFESIIEMLYAYCSASLGIDITKKFSVDQYLEANIAVVAALENLVKIFTSAGMSIADVHRIVSIIVKVYRHNIRAVLTTHGLKANLTFGPGLVETAHDLISEALTYSGGNWWDGSFCTSRFPHTYTLESSTKKTGTYAIRSTDVGQFPTWWFGWSYKFTTPPLSHGDHSYQYLHFWVYCPYDLTQLSHDDTEFSFFMFGTQNLMREYYWDMHDIVSTWTIGWHEVWIDLKNPDGSYGSPLSWSNANTITFYAIWQPVIQEYCYCIVDDIYFYNHSNGLKAALTTKQLKADLTFGTGEIDTAHDLITEATSYDVGEWWDGEYTNNGLTMAEYTLDASNKKTGSYAIKSTDYGQFPTWWFGWAYELDNYLPSNFFTNYPNLHLWLYCPYDLTQKTIANKGAQLYFMDYDDQNIMYYDLTSQARTWTPGWYELTIHLGTPTGKNVNFNMNTVYIMGMRVRWAEEVQEYCYCNIDDVYFFNYSKRLKATLTVPKRLKTKITIGGD